MLTCFYIPWFTVAFLFIVLSVVLIDWTMHHGVKETKRLDNQLKAPVIHHITSSMAGIVTIRAFQKEEVFLQRFNRFLNTSTSADSLFRLSTRWFMWRMETMALVAVTLTSVFCVAFKVGRASSLISLCVCVLSTDCDRRSRTCPRRWRAWSW